MNLPRSTTSPDIRSTMLRRAFTVTELLVVMVIVAILLAIAVPSFQGMIRSSEEALADSLLQSAIKAGRTAALKSSPGKDAALVFFFEPGNKDAGGRVSAVVYVKAGIVSVTEDGSDSDAQNAVLVDREVFVPAGDFAPIRLPRNWIVRAAVNGLDPDEPSARWYNNNVGGTYRYVNASGQQGVVNWVFPETGLYDSTRQDQGLQRSTFMIRFQGGSGAMIPSPQSHVLVLAPRATSENRPAWQTGTGTSRWDPSRAPWTGDLEKYFRAVQSLAPQSADPVITDVFGRNSSDVIMTRSVSVLALYNERKLAAALGVRLDEETGTLYEDPIDQANASASSAIGPVYVPDVDPRKINQWIEGDTNFNGNQDINTGGDFPEAKLFAIDRFTGAIKRLQVQGDPAR